MMVSRQMNNKINIILSHRIKQEGACYTGEDSRLSPVALLHVSTDHSPNVYIHFFSQSVRGSDWFKVPAAVDHVTTLTSLNRNSFCFSFVLFLVSFAVINVCEPENLPENPSPPN